VASQKIRIDRTWDGEAVEAGAVVNMRVEAASNGLCVSFEAPFVHDPPPTGPPGPTPGLWNFEVVELFVLGEDERYVEVEVGPHGHHLVLELHGVRRVVREMLPLEYDVRIETSRWCGRFIVPTSLLPPGVHRYNAHAIRGLGSERRYLAAHPAGGDAPDFHRLSAFASLGADLVNAVSAAKRSGRDR